MDVDRVTLSERAQKLCAQHGIAESDLKIARASEVSSYEGREYWVVIGELPDGRSVRMSCQHGRTGHIVTFRPLS
jgi:hypothetical protein